MTRYHRVHLLQEPFDLGEESGWVARAFNVSIERAYSTESVELGLAAVLAAAGVGTVGTTILTTSHAAIPTNTGPYLVVIRSPGLEPRYVHDAPLPHIQRTSAQVVVRAKYDLARDPPGAVDASEAMAWAAYTALGAVVNADVTPATP